MVGKHIATRKVLNAEEEDVAQILRMHVAQKAAAHDPGRSSLRTYIDRIIRNRLRDYLDEYFAGCRDPLKVSHSLDEPMPSPEDEHTSFSETVDMEEALRRAGHLPWAKDDALVLDVKLVLEDLSEMDRLTCDALAVTKSLREAAKSLGIHVETLRERVTKIRAEFVSRGITGA